MAETDLHRVIYVSRSKLTGADYEAAVESIEAEAQEANAKVGVTGLLIATSNGIFVQALEGPRTSVADRFVGIASDPRHHSIVVVESAAAQGRLFPGWSMMTNRMSPTAEMLIESMNGYGVFDPSRLEGSVARNLLVSIAAALR